MKTLQFVAVVTALLWCSVQVQESLAMPANKLLLKAQFYEFLLKYGYFDEDLASKTDGEPLTPEEEKNAVRSMQRMAGLPATGEMDEVTAEMLNKPRCGVKDGNPRHVIKGTGTRLRRYSVLGDPYKWADGKTQLTYKIVNYPGETSTATRDEVDEDIVAAFKVWSDVTPLRFNEVHTDDADIKILFGSRAHTRVEGDPPFDGPGGTLAHAFTPNSGWGDTDGDVHLDDDETFSHGVYSGTNLFYTLTHEIGHAIGMFHSDVPGALMGPYSRGYDPNFVLPADDILGIQELYGPNNDVDPVTEPPKKEDPIYCSTTFNAIAFINKQYFVFGNGMLWRFDSDRNLLSPLEGQSPRDVFPNFPLKGVKAVYQVNRTKEVIVFKGKNYWRYEESAYSTLSAPLFQLKDIDPEAKTDFPQHVRDIGFPRAVSGVVHIPEVNFSYVVRGKKVSTRKENGPTKTSNSVNFKTVFEGVTDRPTVSFFAEGFANILTGMDYYRYVYDFKTSTFVALNGYPRNFAEEFLRCPVE